MLDALLSVGLAEESADPRVTAISEHKFIVEPRGINQILISDFLEEINDFFIEFWSGMCHKAP